VSEPGVPGESNHSFVSFQCKAFSILEIKIIQWYACLQISIFFWYRAYLTSCTELNLLLVMLMVILSLFLFITISVFCKWNRDAVYCSSSVSWHHKHNYDPNEGFIYIQNVDIKFSAHDANNSIYRMNLYLSFFYK
jgi:hypothetical protein